MMKTKYLGVAALSAAVCFGVVVGVGPRSHGQGKAAAPQMSTNWVGNLVIGKKEAGDPIAGPGPFPHADAQVEIGLRSDGVVVWRHAKR